MAVISSIVEGLERRGRHNVNRVAVSCVVLNNELFIFVYPLQHMVVDQHMTQPFFSAALIIDGNWAITEPDRGKPAA